MSDRAIPRSFRFMEGFGVHTFRLVTAEGRSTLVKFHWKPKLGLQSVVWNEAVKINCADPDFHRRPVGCHCRRRLPRVGAGPAAVRRGLRRPVPADQKIDGGPLGVVRRGRRAGVQQGTQLLAALPAARDFVADPFAHCKFIGYTDDAMPLFEAAGLAGLIDDGFADLGRGSAADFLSRCAQLRFWPRQAGLAEKAAAAARRG